VIVVIRLISHDRLIHFHSALRAGNEEIKKGANIIAPELKK
jgi:hypothetical protein